MARRIRLKVSIASAAWSYAPGDELEVGVNIDAEEAIRWLKAGIAEAVERRSETATAEPPENAMLPTAKRRKVGR